MGVKWTTRKVNDYKWGEREPGITMDEYAGGPFGFDDVKRSSIWRANLNKVKYSQHFMSLKSQSIENMVWKVDKRHFSVFLSSVFFKFEHLHSE